MRDEIHELHSRESRDFEETNSFDVFSRAERFGEDIRSLRHGGNMLNIDLRPMSHTYPWFVFVSRSTTVYP
jgi:hypothetical protein